LAGPARLLRAVELGLHPLAALVRAGPLAGNSATAVSARRGPGAFYRWLPRQVPPVRDKPRRRAERPSHRAHQGRTQHQNLRLGRGPGPAHGSGHRAPGQTYEVEASAPLLETLRRILLVGDKGFDSDALRRQMLAQGCLASVPPRSGRRAPAWFHRGLYRQRHKIENFFQRIKIYKRVSTRYEKLALTFLNFILVAAVFDWLKSF